MVATILDGHVEKAVEFVEETAFDTFPTDPTMLGWGGYANPAKIKKTAIFEDFHYLKAADATNQLQATQSNIVSEAFEITIENRPTDFSMLPYMLCAATASTYAIGDNIFDVAIGSVVNGEYETFNGGCFNKYELVIEEDKAAVETITGMFASSSGVGSSDYMGAGAHAADPSGSVLGWSGITSMLYDASALSVVNAHVDSLKFGIEYDVKPVRDLSATNTSKIAGWAFGPRNISLELGMSIDDMTLGTELLAGAAHTLAFTALTKAFTFSNVKWKGDWEENLAKDDIVGMSLKADKSVSLAIA
ncbi:MAG: hypothetical protein KAS66_02735 [Candidatus Omnitrophica bacterium]|nr:hypothetical protein [Candidatus Omnitrophota bacterium]